MATAAWPKVQASARRGCGTVARPSSGVGGRAAAAVPSRRARQGGRVVIAAVKRLLDCSLGRVDAAIDADLLRAWYKDRVKGLLGIVRATCHVLECGRRHIGKARALLRVSYFAEQ